MNLTFFTNIMNILALFIICWGVNEIVKNLIYGIIIMKTIKHLKDIPDDQSELLIKNSCKKYNVKK